MKKFFKKFLTLAIVSITTLTNSITTYTYAQELNNKNPLKSDNFTITTLSDEDIPKNINKENIPSFSSVEEAKSYMNQIIHDFNKINFQNSSETKSKILQTKSTIANGTIVKSGGSPNLGINTLKVEIGFKYSLSPKIFKSLTYAKSYMTGISLSGISWVQTSPESLPTYRIIDGGRTATVTINGILEGYLLINSKYTKITSEAKTITIEFYNSEI